MRLKPGFQNSTTRMHPLSVAITWTWIDGRKKHHFYDAQSTCALEDSREEGGQLRLVSEGKECTVSLDDMLHNDRFILERITAGMMT